MARIKNVRNNNNKKKKNDNNKKKKFCFQNEHAYTLYKNMKIESDMGRCTDFDDCPLSKTHKYGFKYVVKGGKPMYGTRDTPYKCGKTASVDLPLIRCRNGIHYSTTVSDAIMYITRYLRSEDLRLYQVVGCGEHIINNTKSCSQHVHFGKMIDKKKQQMSLELECLLSRIHVHNYSNAVFAEKSQLPILYVIKLISQHVLLLYLNVCSVSIGRMTTFE